MLCSAAEDDSTFAREKFGSQKAISSDMYFGRNDYDSAVVSEAQQFRGATAISSSAYFSREEEEENGPGSPGMGGMEGLLADGSLSGLENAARDVIQRVMANPDVQNVGDSIRAGALKVRLDMLFIQFPKI